MRIRPLRTAFFLYTAPVALALLAGYGEPGEKLYDVYGTVTYEGKPVPVGQIFFDPDPTKGGSGQQGTADVLDGKFDTALKGKGIRGGGYVVRVSAFNGQPANEAPQGKSLFDQIKFQKDFPKERSELTIEVPKK